MKDLKYEIMYPNTPNLKITDVAVANGCKTVYILGNDYVIRVWDLIMFKEVS